MQPPQDHRPFKLRLLLECARTPFTAATFGPRTSIFTQGDACDSVMHIEAGLVRLVVSAPSGKEAVCGLLGAGAFLGEDALGGQPFRRETATAMVATDVLVVAKALMIRLLRTEPAIADRFLAHVLQREARLEADLADQLLHSSEQRLARTLLVLAACGDRRGRRWALPDVSQELIAEMVGTTRSRVNVFMAKFRKLGFLEEDGDRLRVTPSLLRVVDDGVDVSNTEQPRTLVGR